MRSVWGWTPASSAATEMTKTAWRRSRSATSHPQVRPRRGIAGSSELLEGLSLGVGEAGGDGDLDADQQVAGRLAVDDPPALDPERATGPGAGGDAQGHRAPVEGGHGDVGAQGG